MSDIHVRRLGDDDVPAAAAMTARIFASGEEEQAGMTALLEAAYRTCPYMPPSLCWGAFDGDRLAAKWQILDFSVRVAGNVLRVAGIQGVVASPDENFKGYPMLIAKEGIGDVIAEGFTMAMGFAQRGGLYVKIGGVPIAPEYRVEIDARAIPPLAESEDPFRLLESEQDVAFVLDVYNETNAGRSGSFVRTPEYWPWMVRKPDAHWITDDGYIGVIENENDLELKEVGARDPGFYDLAARKLSALARGRGHGRIWGRIPPDHPFCDVARRYGLELKTSVPKRSGCIGMVLNPAGFAEAVRPGLDARARSLGLPPLALAFGGGGFDGTLTLEGAGSGATREIVLALPSSSLLQWCFGFRSVTSALVEHGASVSPADLELLDALFPVGVPFTWGSDRY